MLQLKIPRDALSYGPMCRTPNLVAYISLNVSLNVVLMDIVLRTLAEIAR